MGWITRATKNAAKYGVKYGPHAKVAWEVGGKHLQAAARAKLDELTLRRKAFDEADSTRDGSVLRVVEQGEPVFVVFSGDDPVAAYPRVQRPLAEVVRRADLDKRVTVAAYHEQQLRARARRAGARVAGARRRRKSLSR
jgi:hypothetical protein